MVNRKKPEKPGAAPPSSAPTSEPAPASPAAEDWSDTSDAAERLTSGGELDDETSEELGVDNIVGPVEAGAGDGLDEQEEAREGITDEEIAKKARRRGSS